MNHVSWRLELASEWIMGHYFQKSISSKLDFQDMFGHCQNFFLDNVQLRTVIEIHSEINIQVLRTKLCVAHIMFGRYLPQTGKV